MSVILIKILGISTETFVSQNKQIHTDFSFRNHLVDKGGVWGGNILGKTSEVASIWMVFPQTHIHVIKFASLVCKWKVDWSWWMLFFTSCSGDFSKITRHFWCYFQSYCTSSRWCIKASVVLYNCGNSWNILGTKDRCYWCWFPTKHGLFVRVERTFMVEDICNEGAFKHSAGLRDSHQHHCTEGRHPQLILTSLHIPSLLCYAKSAHCTPSTTSCNSHTVLRGFIPGWDMDVPCKLTPSFHGFSLAFHWQSRVQFQCRYNTHLIYSRQKEQSAPISPS